MSYYVLLLLLLVLSVSNVFSSDNCLSKFNCQLDINGTKIVGIKNCTLPNMPNMTIRAVDVLDADGTLKHYWARHTVCDVLGWMQNGVEHIEPNYTGIDPRTIAN